MRCLDNYSIAALLLQGRRFFRRYDSGFNVILDIIFMKFRLLPVFVGARQLVALAFEKTNLKRPKRWS